jgi:hypothetical protein
MTILFLRASGLPVNLTISFYNSLSVAVLNENQHCNPINTNTEGRFIPEEMNNIDNFTVTALANTRVFYPARKFS